MALVDDIITLLTTAANNGVSHGNQSTTEANNAKTTPDTKAGNCIEGFDVLDDSRGKAFISHEEAGQAKALLSVLLNLQALGLLGLTPTNAQITDATTKRDNAVNAANAADAAIAAAEPVVLQNYVNCLGPIASADLIQCITDAMNALDAATTAVTAWDGFGPGNLPNIVQHVIAQATSQPTAFPDCNQGLNLLVRAQGLVNTANSKLNDLQNCLNRSDANPAIPVVALGLSKLSSAQQNLINPAASKLDASNVDVQRVWVNRVLCRIQTKTIGVHVTDESGDDFHAGALVNIFHPLIEAITL